MYRHVPRTEILAVLAHLRELHRQITPTNDRERYAFERRELVTKNILSNLRRTGDHPMLSMLLEIADMFSLTIEGAHRLFGFWRCCMAITASVQQMASKDVLLTVEDVVQRLNVPRDRIWRHLSRRAAYLSVIGMSNGVFRHHSSEVCH